MKSKISPNIVKILTIACIVFAISLLTGLVSLFVTYPTPEHVETARQLAKANAPVESLLQSAEAKYSLNMIGITAVMNFVVSVALIVYTYN